MERKKIGILGGTFNPIHNGHIKVAEAVCAYLELDQIWFMPSGISYLKDQSEIVSANHRLEMTRLAIKNYPKFFCSDFEVRMEGNTYTADTLTALHNQYPEMDFYFILGADSLLGLPTWKNPGQIAELCTLVSVIRDETDEKGLLMQKRWLEQNYGARVVLVPFRKVDISSSEIRDNLASREEIDNFVPKEVQNYIYEHGLYQEN